MQTCVLSIFDENRMREPLLNFLRKALLTVWAIFLACPAMTAQAAAPTLKSLETEFSKEIQPLLNSHCYECHSDKVQEADLDLASFNELAKVRKKIKTWQKVGEMLDSKQMPPKEAKQFSANEQ